jgi:hypothetical protein
MVSEISDTDLSIFLSKVFDKQFSAQDLKINLNKLMTTAEFNQLKEQIKQYSEFYRVSNRQYKYENTVYIYYKFWLRTNQILTITTIHEWGSPFIFVRYLKLKSINKGD